MSRCWGQTCCTRAVPSVPDSVSFSWSQNPCNWSRRCPKEVGRLLGRGRPPVWGIPVECSPFGCGMSKVDVPDPMLPPSPSLMTTSGSPVGLLPTHVVIRGFAVKTKDMLVGNGLYTDKLPSHKSSPTVLPDRPKALEVPVLGWGVCGVYTGS